MIAMVFNSMDIGDIEYAESIEMMTGYTLKELYLVEAAFEGQPYQPGIKRMSHNAGLPLEKRVYRVLDVLQQLEELSPEEVKQWYQRTVVK